MFFQFTVYALPKLFFPKHALLCSNSYPREGAATGNLSFGYWRIYHIIEKDIEILQDAYSAKFCLLVLILNMWFLKQIITEKLSTP